MMDKNFETRLLKMAIEYGQNSPDPRTHIGALVFDNTHRKILSVACNVPVSSNLSCYCCVPDEEIPRKEMMLHAERAAIYQAIKHYDLHGATLYTNGVPCHNCCITAIYFGIKNIVVHSYFEQVTPHKDYFTRCELMLHKHGVNVFRVSDKLDLQVLFDGELITI